MNRKPSAIVRVFVVAGLAVSLLACNSSERPDLVTPAPQPTATPTPTALPVACVAEQFCAGAAKRRVTPSQEHIDGVAEPRFGGTVTHLQKFNLGGFGINPTQNFPDPFSEFAEALTQPAQERVYVNRQVQDEDTWVRVLILQGPDDAGQTQRVAFVSLDAIGAGNLIQERVMAAVNEISCAQGACIEPPAVLFGQTHTHAGADLQGLWGGVPQDWIDNMLLTAVREAAAEALSRVISVKLIVGQGINGDFNNYRRPRIDPDAQTDETLSLLRVEPLAGGPLVASLLQYSAHPTSINEDPRIPHADYILGLAETLEQDGGVALFFNGPIADASGSGGDCSAIAEPNAYDRVRCRGHDLAQAAKNLLPGGRTLQPLMAVRHAEASLPVTNPAFQALGSAGSFNRYYNFYPREVREIPVLGEVIGTSATELGQITPVADTFVTRITLGGPQGMEIVTIPGEATGTFGQYIRSLADPAAYTLLFGLTQNSFGYIIPEEEFNYVDLSGDAGLVAPFTGYEEFVSLGPLTAPLLRLQAYQPLFDASPDQLPAYLATCSDPLSETCLLNNIAQRVDYAQRAYARTCLENGAPAEFCALLNPDTPLSQPCRDAGLPSGVCDALGAPPAE